MNSLADTFTLNNGVKIPCVGFGTWQTPDGDVAEHVVKVALEAGYRHIDTAAAYGNEEGVGRGMKASGLPREEIFLTTKLWNENHGYEATHKAVDDSLQRLGTDYIDLYLIHWPNPVKFRKSFEQIHEETWRAMEEIYKAGKVRAIGVSNFEPRHMDLLYKTSTVEPAANQIRLYPGYTMPETVAYCREWNILLEAYSPFGTGKLLGAQELKPLAEKYGKSPAQVCLRWSLQRGFLPLPKSVTDSRIVENGQVFDFALTEEELALLDGIPNYCGPGKNPDETSF